MLTARMIPLTLALVALPVLAGEHRGHFDGDNVSINSDGPISSCEDIRVRFGSRAAVRGEETFTVAGSVRTFKLDSAGSGGVQVTGWDGKDYSVTACKAASTDSGLASLRVSAKGGEVSAEQGEGRSMVYFLVKAPRNASLDLQTSNGPMCLLDVNGDMVLRVENGPLSLKRVNGRVDGQSVNGPISFAGGSGDWKLRAENGPISAKLQGRRWDGGSLDAKAMNGPVTLKIDPDFESGIQVTRSGHNPFSCYAAGCPETRRSRHREDDDDDRERTVQIGSGSPVIRIAAVNGPISVKDGVSAKSRNDD